MALLGVNDHARQTQNGPTLSLLHFNTPAARFAAMRQPKYTNDRRCIP